MKEFEGTKGEAEILDDAYGICLYVDKTSIFDTSASDAPYSEDVENMRLAADAFNTINETNQSPSELREENERLKELLKEFHYAQQGLFSRLTMTPAERDKLSEQAINNTKQ